MRLLVVGCVALLLGLSIGFYGASAAGTIQYTSYISGKDVPGKSSDFMNGYVAGAFDTLEWVVWIANDDPKTKDDFTPAYFTPLYQCLQKIPNAGEAVAWAKDIWAANPNNAAANLMAVSACQYKPSQAKSNTVTGGAGKGPSRGATLRR